VPDWRWMPALGERRCRYPHRTFIKAARLIASDAKSVLRCHNRSYFVPSPKAMADPGQNGHPWAPLTLRQQNDCLPPDNHVKYRSAGRSGSRGKHRFANGLSRLATESRKLLRQRHSFSD